MRFPLWLAVVLLAGCGEGTSGPSGDHDEQSLLEETVTVPPNDVKKYFFESVKKGEIRCKVGSLDHMVFVALEPSGGSAMSRVEIERLRYRAERFSPGTPEFESELYKKIPKRKGFVVLVWNDGDTSAEVELTVTWHRTVLTD